MNSDESLDEIRQAFWSDRAINIRAGIDSPETLWEFLVDPQRKLGAWPVVAGETLFFRGQSDHSWGLTSSLLRFVRSIKPKDEEATEHDLRMAEHAAIETLRGQGLGRNMTDGQLLMVMQHHRMPTRLLDVSRTPLEALYFAVEQNEDRDGLLFLINPHEPLSPDGAKLHRHEQLPWRDMVVGVRRASSEWTNAVWLVDHKSLDPRMHAQNGVFLVGGLAKKYEGTSYRVPGLGVLPAQQHAELSSFSVNWLKSVTADPNTRWGASGWVLAVPAEWKRSLRARLKAEVGIWSDSMYPPLAEVERLVGRVVRDLF